ncbi:PEPxxWA-CTERM sorting domain-containing protein [Sphingomonas sp.]|uniref:PEPxxWA-CTERM sorting domain-containing protein n=1 Tax=Sphingomonas sp. TaxID=28214 RepID=UPI002DBED400|nr:PEPxxWA-CTERM sorting domain-containing protein [Sphingomonas sp.]HEU4969635.1 PEPxxWA-CTERM sorting domain-containing protein [Sphingomonas sp.]
MKIAVSLAAIAATIAFASAAQASDTGVVIHDGVQQILPGVFAYDSVTEQGGGGYTKVTNSAPRAAPGTPGANGSLEIHGDRSRYVIGSIYKDLFPGTPAVSIGAFNVLSQLDFDWQTGVVGSGQTHAAPAVRIHIIDNGVRSEMIWEQVYNGGASGVAPPSGWQTAGDDSLFYLNVRDNGADFLASHAGYTLDAGTKGVVLFNGGQVNRSIGSWQSLFSADAYITGFSFGAGSGFGSNFVGYVDNVRIRNAFGDTTIINFEAVPEPATWAMMIGGFAFVGAAARRRKTRVVFA